MTKSQSNVVELPTMKSPGDRGNILPQVIVGFGVMMILVQLGISSGWSSPYLAQLTGDDSILPLSLNQASWVVALLNLGRLVGAFAGAVSANYVGSKKTMLLILSLMSTCWILTILARDPFWLYAARFSAGMALGVMFSSYPLYLGEVALPEIRGALVSLAASGMTFGLTLGSVLNSFLPMQTSAGIYLVPCLVLMALFVWLPESPHHLVKVNQPERAKESIRWYRSNRGVEEELGVVTRFQSKVNSQSFSDKIKDFGEPAIRRATVLTVVLWIFMQISGYNIVLAYMEIVLTRGRFTLIQPKVAVVYVNASSIIASTLSIFMIERCGRRILLVISGLGSSIAMSAMGTHFVLLDGSSDTQWLLLSSIILFQTAVFLGLMCVPSAILGELFPANVKFIAACLASAVGAIFAFLDTKSYQPLVELIGQSNVFFGHAAMIVLVVPFALLFLPETKGKTLEQIQEDLTKVR